VKYINGSIKKYLKDLAARTPAPGGGSAAALSVAMAAGLLAMAAGFTLGKKSFKKVSRVMRSVLTRATQIRKRAEVLLDKDIRAYQSKNFRDAFAIPAEVARLSCETAQLAEKVLCCGNPHLATDAVLAVFLAEAALTAAVFYVQVNIKYLGRGRAAQEKSLRDLKAMLPKIKKLRCNAEEFVGTSFGW